MEALGSIKLYTKSCIREELPALPLILWYYEMVHSVWVRNGLPTPITYIFSLFYYRSYGKPIDPIDFFWLYSSVS